MTLISPGKLTAISAKCGMISSKFLPTTPKQRPTKVGGFVFLIGNPEIEEFNL